LGDWWEQTHQAPIPLGGIVMKRSFPIERIAQVDALIKKSLLYAWKHYPQLAPFVTENAQEMEEAVMRQHIELYVNDSTTDLGRDGENAVKKLFEEAVRTGVLSQAPTEILYS